MWLIWIAFILGIVVIFTFAYRPRPDSDKWNLELTWAVAMVVLLTVPLSLRFLVVPRMKEPWLIFLIFLVGLFFADMISMVSMFALANGQNSCILIGFVTLLLYCPHWILNKKIG
jgi:uncharacterized membrane protein